MALKHILGTVPVIEILDHLLDNDGTDYTKDEIQNYAGVRNVDMKAAFPCLVESGVITETRKIRGASLYKLDHDNHVAQALTTFNAALTDTQTEEKCFIQSGIDYTQEVRDMVVFNGGLPDDPEEES